MWREFFGSRRRQIALGRIRYRNVSPVYDGLDNGMCPPWLRMVSGHPVALNRMLASGRLDISPVSVSAYARNPDAYRILPDLCVGSRERVMSVLLISRCPLSELEGKTIGISRESATGSDLVRLIFYLKGLCPRWEEAGFSREFGLEPEVDAALVIGDDALAVAEDARFPYIYDLGAEWWLLTGVPFVWAVWVVRRGIADTMAPVVDEVGKMLGASLRFGISRLTRIAKDTSRSLGIPRSLSASYFQLLGYELGPEETEGLRLFFRFLGDAGIIPAGVDLHFFHPAPAGRNPGPSV